MLAGIVPHSSKNVLRRGVGISASNTNATTQMEISSIAAQCRRGWRLVSTLTNTAFSWTNASAWLIRWLIIGDCQTLIPFVRLQFTHQHFNRRSEKAVWPFREHVAI